MNIWSVKFVRPCMESILGIILLEQNRVAKKKKTCQLLGSGMSVKKRVSASIAKRGKNFNYV